MEQPSGRGQEGAWRAAFQRIYLSRLVAFLRRQKVECETNLSARSRTMKSSADLSMALTSRGRSAWSRKIICKYIFRHNKAHRRLQVVKSRWNSQGKRRSLSAKARLYKPNAACNNSGRQLTRANPGLRVITGIRSPGNCDEEAGGAVASRMQILRRLVPGSRRLGTAVFLKEAAEYIVALKMQVQAMQALADYYSNSKAHAAGHASLEGREIESRLLNQRGRAYYTHQLVV